MTKREYIRRYMRSVRRIERDIERLSPRGDRKKVARRCRETGQAIAESNARELYKMRDSDRRMRQSLKEVENGCIRPFNAVPECRRVMRDYL